MQMCIYVNNTFYMYNIIPRENGHVLRELRLFPH